MGRPDAHEAELLEALQPGMLALHLKYGSLDHLVPHKFASKLLLATEKANITVHKLPHGNFGDIEVRGYRLQTAFLTLVSFMGWKPSESAPQSSQLFAWSQRPSWMHQAA